MAVKKEYPYKDGNGVKNFDLVRTYSDENRMLIQVETGIEYEEAIDIVPCQYTYIEKEIEEDIDNPEQNVEFGENDILPNN